MDMSKKLPQGWKKVNLKDYINVMETGKRPKGGAISDGIPSLGGEHINYNGQLNISLDKMKFIPKEYYESLKSGKIEIGDILIVKDGATTGKVGIVKDNFPFPKACINEHLFRLKANEKLSQKYLYYYFKSDIGQYNILKDFRGATVGGISKGFIDMNILLPPLEEQERIVSILERAEDVICKREESNRLLDEYLKSVFVDMFGDPSKNIKKWEIYEIGKFLDILTDYHANGSYESLSANVKLLDTPDYALMVRTTDLENKNFEKDVKYIDEHAYNHLQKSKVFGGEIIINKIGSAGKVYLMPYLNRPVSLAMNQFMLKFNEEKVNHIFLYNLLLTPYMEAKIKEKVRGAVTKTITKDAIREIKIIVPPIEMQNEFVQIVNQVDQMKLKMEESLAELQNNFNSLMQKAFNGEL